MPDPITPFRERDLCFIDLETTGSIFEYHEIIEAGVIRTTANGETVLGECELRFRPTHPERLTAEAREVNGFDPSQWTPSHADELTAWTEFLGLMSNTVSIAHNPAFDRSFLEHTLRRCGITSMPSRHWIGTESLAWPYVIKGLLSSTRLEDICAFLGIAKEPLPHRALNGARVARQVYCGLIRRLQTG